MRLRHPDGTTVHLGYCSNVHQAEDVDGVLAQLADHASPVRERLGADRLGIGLWLARDVVSELVAVPGEVKNLRAELAARGLETVTLYAGFHREVVKKDVYLPDWADEARLAHTLDCARVLAALLPDDAERGSVSTLPLAWRTPWPPDRADTARRALDRLAAGLAAIESDTGRRIRVGFEPEPGCVVETTAQAVRELRGLDPERLGVCLDACHLAVQFEEPGAALRRLADAGLPVVKLQASCAVEAADPADPAAHAALRRLAEPRFLHQTRTAARQESPDVRGVDDLPEALEGGGHRPLARPLPRTAARRPRTAAAHHRRPAEPGPGRTARRGLGPLRPHRGRDLHLVRPPRTAHRPARRHRRRTRLGPGPVDRPRP
jgi:sugar phosphate isomerase/epimerase